MIVDTNLLRRLIDTYEAEEAARLDSTIKSDREAIAALTRAETRSIKRQEIIEALEDLAREYPECITEGDTR